MKPEDLFDAIGGADELLLEEHAAPAGRKLHWVSALVSAAACIGIVSAAVLLLPHTERIETRETTILESSVSMSETYFNSPPTAPAEHAQPRTPAVSTVTTSEICLSVNSFHYVLTQIYENQNDAPPERFVICDINSDGSEELVILWAETGLIYSQDQNGNLISEFLDISLVPDIPFRSFTQEEIDAVLQ